MKFKFGTASEIMENSEYTDIEINNIQELLDIVDKYNRDIIIFYGDKKVPYIMVHDDYIE